jgi:hypothetical protein
LVCTWSGQVVGWSCWLLESQLLPSFVSKKRMLTLNNNNQSTLIKGSAIWTVWVLLPKPFAWYNCCFLAWYRSTWHYYVNELHFFSCYAFLFYSFFCVLKMINRRWMWCEPQKRLNTWLRA